MIMPYFTHTHQFAVVPQKHAALSMAAQLIARYAQILDELQIILSPGFQLGYAAPMLRCGCNEQLTGIAMVSRSRCHHLPVV